MLPVIANTVLVEFKPKLLDNTQLISGQAYVDINTGRVMKVTFKGEFDMIRFNASATMGEDGARSLLPKECNTNVIFKLMGNQIFATTEAVYD